MVKRRSPRILAATALTVLVAGLSACGTPQTLVPYTPAQGVNADAQRQGAPEGSNEVPLKIRNLTIVSEPGSGTGFLAGSLIAPTDRADALVGVGGRTLTAENEPGTTIPPISLNMELPAGRMVILSEQPPIRVSAPELRPGLVAEVRLIFEDSEAQALRVPIMDATHPDYRDVEPGSVTASPEPSPGEGAEATPAAPGEGAEAAPVPPAEGEQNNPLPTSPEPTPGE